MTGIRGGQLEFFSKDEIYNLHTATLEVLENTGVVIQENHALEVMHDSGAYVDERSQLVRIPPYLVEECIKKIPSSIKLYGRNPVYDIPLYENTVYVGAGINAVRIIDLYGNMRRPYFKDLEELTRLQDSLENIHVMENPIISDFIDLPKKGIYKRCYEVVLTNSEKHVINQVEGVKDVRDEVDMACEVMDWDDPDEFRKRPIFSIAPITAPPLKWGKIKTEVLIEGARLGVPLIIESDPSAGGTAPITLAGILVQQNAEILSGIVLSQLINPGNPVMYLAGANVLDPRTAIASFGAPECRLYYAATAQLCRYYHLPSMGVSLTTDSKTADVQSGYEKAIAFLFAALTGVNIIEAAAGMLDNLLTVCYAQSMIDNEIIGMVRYILEKNELTSRSIEEAVEVIDKVGPTGGHYLSQKHTLDNIADEFIPQISDRRPWALWEKSGRKSAVDIARDRARKNLNEHKIDALPSDVIKKIHKIACS